MKHWIQVIISFIFGQIGVQLLQIIIGFLLIRWLPYEDYAVYSVVFSFQVIAITLTDLGISNSIVALVGKNVQDKMLVSRYVTVAYKLRLHFFVLSSVGLVLLFPLVFFEYQWPWYYYIYFILNILWVVYSNGQKSIYKTTLVMHREIKQLYLAENLGASLKLTLIVLSNFFFTINSKLAILFHTLSITFTAFWVRIKSNKNIAKVAEEKTDEIATNIKNHIYPTLPGIIFSTFQGQISIFIISLFGSIQNVAEVGALGKLAQVFSFFNVASVIIIGPYFAKLEYKKLFRSYLVVLFAATLLMLILYVLVINHSEILIWLLGNKYSHLNNVFYIVILNASIVFISNLMWSIQSARRWIYKWMPFVSIPGTLMVQFFLIVFLDLSSTEHVLWFMVFTSIFTLLFRVGCALFGFIKTEKLLYE